MVRLRHRTDAETVERARSWHSLGVGVGGVALRVPLVQVGRAATWIAWWSLNTVGLRVLIVWLFNNTGKSVFAATLFHANEQRELDHVFQL